MNSAPVQRTLISLATLSLVLLTSFSPFFSRRAEAQFVRPFGGYIVNVDYQTCTCGFIIFTVYDKTTYTEYRIIYFYLLQFLEKLGIGFPDWLSMGIPRIYEYYAIWPGSQANVVGNYIPYTGGATCWAISSTGCSPVTGAGDGYLLNMGTSLLSDG
ncbi:MAG: hypothetical protein AMXMBFR44_2630 [Candidatus Campbellbacteria bacterium]